MNDYKNISATYYKIVNLIFRHSENYVITVTSFFYFALWLFNPGNKLIALSFIPLFIIYNFKLNNIRLSLIITYLASSIIFSGKTYLVQLLPKEMFTYLFNQEGYWVTIVVTPSLIIGILMSVILLRDLILKKIISINFQKKDLFLILYFVIVQLVDIFISREPSISSILSLSSLIVLFVYFFIKSYKPDLRFFIPLIIALLTAQVAFESFIAFQQFIRSSPLGINIEAPNVGQSFGVAPDEINLTFRPMGTIVHANDFAAWLTFYLLIIFAYNYKKKNVLYFFINLIGLCSLVMTLGRISWLAWFTGTLSCLYLFEKIKKIKPPFFLNRLGFATFALAVILSYFFVFPRLEKSLYLNNGGLLFRENQLKAASSIVQTNLLFGVGTVMSLPVLLQAAPGGYFRLLPTTVHNWYVIQLIEHGFFALLSISIFAILRLREEVINLITIPKWGELETIRLGFIAGIMSLVLIGFFHLFIWENLIILTSAILVKNSRESKI